MAANITAKMTGAADIWAVCASVSSFKLTPLIFFHRVVIHTVVDRALPKNATLLIPTTSPPHNKTKQLEIFA